MATSNDDVIKIELEIDVKALRELVESATELNDNQAFFDKLTEFAKVKKQIGEVDDILKSVEADIKGAVNSKGNALYGTEWEAIKGPGYKITKSPTGSVFAISGKVQKKFLVIKEAVDTKAVNSYIKEKGKLPAGLDYNPSRGSSIRITVNEDSQA